MKNKNCYFDCFRELGLMFRNSAEELKNCFDKSDVFVLGETALKTEKISYGAMQRETEISCRLSNEFLPPLDRGDILTLNRALVRCICAVDDSCKSFMQMKSIKRNASLVKIADAVLKQSEIICSFTEDFSRSIKMKNAVQTVSKVSGLMHGINNDYIKCVSGVSTAEFSALCQTLGALKECGCCADDAAWAIKGIIISSG
ncbi:MAG: hypothetical protein IJC37_06590 [Clostridia bacterium]|nr:hypothetical protein [Clostridia bacterium]